MPPSEHDPELRRYLEDEFRREREANHLQELERRVTKLEMAFDAESREWSDTKRFRITQAGVVIPLDASGRSIRPPERRSDSIVPKAVREVLRHKVTFILIGAYEVGRRLIELLLQHTK